MATAATVAKDGGQVAAVKPLLQARPRYGSNDALWAPYLVPPGKYRLNVIVKGMPEPLTVADTLEIQPGQLLVFDSGL